MLSLKEESTVDDSLLTTIQASQLLGVSRRTLEGWRAKGRERRVPRRALPSGARRARG